MRRNLLHCWTLDTVWQSSIRVDFVWMGLTRNEKKNESWLGSSSVELIHWTDDSLCYFSFSSFGFQLYSAEWTVWIKIDCYLNRLDKTILFYLRTDYYLFPLQKSSEHNSCYWSFAWAYHIVSVLSENGVKICLNFDSSWCLSLQALPGHRCHFRIALSHHLWDHWSIVSLKPCYSHLKAEWLNWSINVILALLWLETVCFGVVILVKAFVGTLVHCSVSRCYCTVIGFTGFSRSETHAGFHHLWSHWQHHLCFVGSAD